MRSLTWKFEKSDFYLQPTEEANLWKIIKEKKPGSKETVGHIGVYVDDLMFTSTREIVGSAIEALSKVFQLAPEEHPVTFSWL